MEDLLVDLKGAIVRGDEERAAELVRRALAADFPPRVVLDQGVVAAIKAAGQLWDENEYYFLPDVILAAQAFRSALAVLGPALRSGSQPSRGRAVIATVEGDVHDLGKKIVIAFLAGAGFEVHDLGEDVPTGKIVAAVSELRPRLLGLGAYMTTTMREIKEVIDALTAAGLRDGLKILVGGVPTTQKFCEEVGADAWGRDAIDALAKALTLTD